MPCYHLSLKTWWHFIKKTKAILPKVSSLSGPDDFLRILKPSGLGHSLKEMRTIWSLVLFLAAQPALAGSVVIEDPKGDDDGPGTYVYPTDPVYKKGSFDLTKVEIKDKGDKVQIKVHLKVKVEDPWKSRDWPTRDNGAG